jgi:glucose-6-phosphate 1-epimerase
MPGALSFALVLLAPFSVALAAEPTLELSTCLATLRKPALAAGISHASFDQYTAELAPDPSVLDALDAQPEFVTPIWDYLAALVDEERVEHGLQRLNEHRDVLAQVAQSYGVDAATVVAVWGVESDYGQVFGKRPLLNSLATLSCAGRRQSFFRGEFFAALSILQSGDVNEADLVGSWAGAFGHTQFMPSTFLRIAVDFDGDGRRDLVGSVADALASTANYLAKSNWRSGEAWGFEVQLPRGFDASGTGRKNKRPLSSWAARGILRSDGTPLVGADAPAARKAGLLLPAGVEGPAFIVFRNFDAIHSYNAADSYALAIAHLADRLRGGEAFVTAWPTDDPGLARAQRRELQTRLIACGHDIGAIDGLIGKATREAIQTEQRRLGYEPDGRAGRRLLDALSGCDEEPGLLPAESLQGPERGEGGSPGAAASRSE